MSNIVWKPISGFDGAYEISSTGLVRSVTREIFNGKGVFASKSKILKPNTLAKGYFQVTLYYQNKRICKQVHRLVAEAFIKNPMPDKYNQVNHKDGNKQNNNVDNLEWCDNSLNQIHAWKNGMQPRTKKARKSAIHYRIGDMVFDSIRALARYFGKPDTYCRNNIHRAIKKNGRYKGVNIAIL